MFGLLPRLFQWLGEFAQWLFSPHRVWLGLVVSFVALSPLIWTPSEFWVRFGGFLLQLAGVTTVAIGLHDTRVLFGHPPLGEHFKAWLGAFPPWRRRHVLGVGTMTMGLGTASGRLYVWSPVDRAWPLDRQLTAVIANTERLQESIRTLDRRLDEQGSTHRELLENEERSRQEGDATLSSKLEVAHTGGIYISGLGLFWLVLGLLLATFSGELSTLLQ